nr:PREDICTED: plexin-C1-like [Latimeria chalumnae]|eukprot:XP_014354412.1 PREDICTED: plexin-C1-like [Latimeria chalumnae]
MLVTALLQKINKGPVDAVTDKALYTLNEDWLLWQVTQFTTLKLNITFQNSLDKESGEDISPNIQTEVLDCDSIGQTKKKILDTFLNKYSYPYRHQIHEIGLELQKDREHQELLDVDGSSVILENGITVLNTIGHYKISDGATVTVIKKTTRCDSGGAYSDKYCHLNLPAEQALEDLSKTTGKQKFKVKEMCLTKLLSTKVVCHSFVEKLFRTIWSLQNNKAPIAIKHFFDFLDAQAERKKITDLDVTHIWKTNSLPLRFWINILKNPQFIFDIEKTPHLDSCLSVIAQAFMDAFSLTDHQLGKHAPTNKLLYAKDIPQFKEEVKAYYKQIQELPSLSSQEVEEFLIKESKKHENEFQEAVALMEIYKYITKYFDELLKALEKEQDMEEAKKQLLRVKAYFDDKKKCKWM